MQFLEIIDKAGVPLLIIFIYFLFYKSKKKIISFASKKDKLKEIVVKSFDCFKYNFKVKWYQIALPLIAIVIVDLLIIVKTETLFAPYSEPLWFLIIGRSFLNPISEEILVRGVLVGMLFLTWIPWFMREMFKFKLGYIYISVILILQSIYFARSHGDYELIPMLVRSSGGFIYGLFYVLYNKNLFPATLAHFFHNILITIGYFNPSS